MLFESIIQNAPLGVLVVNQGGDVVYCNPAAEKLFAHLDLKIVGVKIATLIPGAFVLEGSLLLNSFRSQFGENQIALTDQEGGLHHYEFRQNQFTDAGGETLNVVMLNDVTRRVIAQQRLRAQEERWNMALQGSEIGVFESDLRSLEGTATATWFNLLGIEDTENLDSDRLWHERIHPEDRERVLAADEDCISGKTERSETRYRMRHQDGDWRWMHSVLMVTSRDFAGRAVRLLGTMNDITPLEKATELARAREAELRKLIESAPVPMTVLSPDGTLLILNDACLAFLGYSRQDLEGKTLWGLGNTEMLREIQEEVNARPIGEADIYTAEKSYQRPDGSWIDFVIRISKLGGTSRPEQRLIAQMVDITERKRLSRLKDDFVATVSHELRTPLSALSGSLSLMRYQFSDGLGEQPLRLLEMANRNSRRLKQLVDELLDLQQLATGELLLNLQPVNVVDTVEQALEECQPFADKFSVRFTLQPQGGEVIARSDPWRLKQVVTNLLSNAAKFSCENGTVAVRVARRNSACTVSVTDHGRGIAPEFRDRIFRPFSQQSDHSTRDREGSGLGLAICKGLVERMSGEIGYTSVPFQNTTFWVRLPLAAARSSMAPAPEA